jgi:molybdopterin synthase sulfur carrier subunit
MRLTILYFARLREAVGVPGEVVEPPDSVQTLGQLRAWLAGRGEPWRGAFAQVQPVRAAQDHVVGGDDTALRAGAEIAFFPPVTGG